MLGAFAEYYSGSLSTHGKKGKSEQAHKGLHLGGIPFGYESCWDGPKGDRQLKCDPEHSGGVHHQPEEANAVKELFCSYFNGATTLSQQAGPPVQSVGYYDIKLVLACVLEKLPKNGPLADGIKLGAFPLFTVDAHIFPTPAVGQLPNSRSWASREWPSTWEESETLM